MSVSSRWTAEPQDCALGIHPGECPGPWRVWEYEVGEPVLALCQEHNGADYMADAADEVPSRG